MSPVAIDSPPSISTMSHLPPLKSPALVIGSLATANNGSYQSIITRLESSRAVDRLLVDRILDGGTSL